MLISKLQESINLQDSNSISEIILNRIKGKEYNEPLVYKQGEAAIDVLAYFYNAEISSNHKRKRLWENAYLISIVKIKTEILNSENSNQKNILQFYWLNDFFKLGVRTELLKIGNNLDFLFILNYIRHNTESEDNLIFNIIISGLKLVFNFKEVSNSNIISLVCYSLAEPKIAFICASNLAQKHPDVLIKHIGIFLDNCLLLNKKWENLTEIIRLCFIELKDKRAHINLLLDLIRLYANKKYGNKIKKAIIRGLSLANVRFTHVRKVEQTYWDTIDPADVLATYYLAESRDFLRNELTQQLTSRIEPISLEPIRINSIPYAEAAYLRLYQIILQIFYNIEVSIVPTSFNEVGEMLLQNKIDIAIHNDSILNQIDDNKILRSSHKIFEFKKYCLIANEKILNRIILDKNSSKSHRQAASSILAGKKISDFELFQLIKLCKISYLRNTDTEDCFKLFLQSSGIEYDFKATKDFLVNCDPDTGVEKIINGQVGFYLGGALQYHYAIKNFEERVTLVKYLPFCLDEYFYMVSNRYKKDEKFFNQVLSIWAYVNEIWGNMRRIKHAPLQLRRFLNNVRDDILNVVNRNRDIPNGYAESFNDLFKLLTKCNELYSFEYDDYKFIIINEAKVVSLNPININKENES